VRAGAVCDKPVLVYGLARNRRSPKRPPEPRPSGVHPEEGAVEERRRSLPLEAIEGKDGANRERMTMLA
jgi:hypothetical protein